MAALRLMRKWGVPLATAAGAPLLLPVVRAEAGGAEEAKDAPPPPPTSRMVRPLDLPIYEEPEEVLDFEYHGRERSSLEEGVGVVRKEVEGVMEATRTARERIAHIYETGKAHSMATVDYLTDEENMLPRAGAITVGGLAGLVIGARRRGGFIRKVLYTSTGVITAASLCYPRQAYAISQQLYGQAKNYGAIGYNFVVGVKPQSKTPPPPPSPPADTTIEPEKADKSSATPADDAPPAPSEPQAEVRSATTLSLPPGKTLIDTLADQASDVTVWGFRLTDQGSSAAPKATSPKDATVPEGFGSVSTVTDGESAKREREMETHRRQDVEGRTEVTTPVGGEGGSLVEEGVIAIGEKIAKVEEKVEEGVIAIEEEVAKVEEKLEEGVIAIGEKVAEVEEQVSTAVVEVLTPVLGEEEAKVVVEKVEGVVEEAAEKVAEVLEGKVAVVVEEAAKEVEERVAVVEGVLEGVEEVEEKVEKVLNVAERVTEAAEKAVEVFPLIPHGEVEKVEAAVEETKAIVEEVTEATKEGEELVEEVKKDAEKVEEEAAEVSESGEKRKEVLEEIMETLEQKEKEVETPPVERLTPAAAKDKEGLFDKLVSFLRSDKEATARTEKEQTDKQASEILHDTVSESSPRAEREEIIESSPRAETEQITEALQAPAPPPPVLAEPTTGVSVKSEAPDTQQIASIPSTSITAEKIDTEVTENLESVVSDRQEIVDEKEQMEVEGKEEQGEEEAGWVMVEEEKQQGVEEETAREKPQDDKEQLARREEEESREGVQEETPIRAAGSGRREGLFGQLVKLFTKDEEKPVPQEPVPAASGAVGVPLPGEGKGEVLSPGTPVGEDVALSKPENTVNVPDISVIPEDTAQAADVPLVPEDATQTPDTSIPPEDTAQIPSLPTVPDDTVQILDDAQPGKDTTLVPDEPQVPKQTEESVDVTLAFREEVPIPEPGTEEPVCGELPSPAREQEKVVASTKQANSEAAREPADTIGTEDKEPHDVSVLTHEEPTSVPPPPPPPAKQNIFEKLASLFQKEQQQQEPQHHEAATAEVKDPVTEVEEPALEVREDMPASTEQETAEVAGEGLLTADSDIPTVPESHQEESIIIIPTGDEPLSEPTLGITAPPGSDEPETSLVAVGEEDAAVAAAAQTTSQQHQLLSPQVQSPSGGELGEQPSGEVSGVATADTQVVSSTQIKEVLVAMQPLDTIEAAEGQDKLGKPATEPHLVEDESLAAAAASATDTTEPCPEASSEGSRMSISSQDDTFIVRASPNRSSGVEAQTGDQRQSGVALRPGWLRAEGEVKQEGKDVIVKLESPTPEKDYGQSNPEDSDMYTTRG